MMYAADEIYDTAFLEDVLPFVEPCEVIVDGELLDGTWHYTRCGQPSVQADEDGTLCAEHAQ